MQSHQWTSDTFFLLMFSSNTWPYSAPLRDISFHQWTPCDAFLLLFNSNIWLNSTFLNDIRLQSLSDIGFDLSRSLKAICDGAFGLTICDFLLVFN